MLRRVCFASLLSYTSIVSLVGDFPYIRIWTTDIVHTSVAFAQAEYLAAKLAHYEASRAILLRQYQVLTSMRNVSEEDLEAFALAHHLYLLQATYLLDDETIEKFDADSLGLNITVTDSLNLPDTVDKGKLEAFRDSLLANAPPPVTLHLYREEVNIILETPPGHGDFTIRRNEILLRYALAESIPEKKMKVRLILTESEVRVLSIPRHSIWAPFIWIWEQMISIFQ